MLFEYIRLLLKDGVNLDDLSYMNQDESEPVPLNLAPSKSLLVGMNYPFNNFYLYVKNPNAPIGVVPSVEVLNYEDPIEGIPETQRVSFSRVPTEGNFSLSYNGTETRSFNFDSPASEIQDELRLIPSLEDVSVSGNYEGGLLISFINVVDPQDIEVLGNTLKASVKSKIRLQYWSGREWTDVVDIMDGSSKQGVTLSRSGNVLFSCDNDKNGWSKVSDTSKDTAPAELRNVKIYGLYWLRITVDDDVHPDTTLNELSFCFTGGDKLRGVKAEVDKFFDAFKKGKTDWIPETIMASKMVVTELKKAGLVLGPQQVVRLDDFWLPTTYKALWLIYSSLGPAYLETANQMAHEFYKNFNVNNITVDENRDGKVNEVEINSRVKVGVR